MTNAELIKAIRCNDECNNCAIWKHGECNERKMSLAAADALEAQLPKEGEWIDIDGTMFAECSVCGKRHYGCTTPYCDMCGARMRGANDE